MDSTTMIVAVETPYHSEPTFQRCLDTNRTRDYGAPFAVPW